AIRRLEELGGTVFIGHQESNVEGAQVVVVSSAIASSNPEVRAARVNVIPVIPRAEMLAELMRLKFGIAIAGAHGKTTTTSMVASILAQAGLDPTFVIGGKVNAMGTHARLGRSDLLIAEADESDGSFLRLSPSIVVVTNIDREHLDHYGSMEGLQEAFLEFINKIPFYGVAIVCADDPWIRKLLPRVVKRYHTYGMSDFSGVLTSDLYATEIETKALGVEFRAHYRDQKLGPFRIRIPGVHNVTNALAAIGVALELDVPVDLIRAGLAAFAGVERRFQIRGEKNGIVVVDDYGHHPTEIRATLAAARAAWQRPLIVVFQPHRFSRTRDLADEFAKAFEQADRVYVMDIYPAGEAPIPGITGQMMAETIQASGHPSVQWLNRDSGLIAKLREELRDGDVLLTLGAGDVWKVGTELLESL
ncbi:MAG TPA: UDP-N-acetylmuramate--L-alanine ligase, partial [Nitrospiraceae bacterium]|nr:UDP-N-acetylmuramate--L-alanine ligase [Nitrospiraceae bacterium]